MIKRNPLKEGKTKKWQVTSLSGTLRRFPTFGDMRGQNNLNDKSLDEVRAAMGDEFPKLIYHSIICIGALVASRTANGYEVQAVGAPHVGQRTEKELIEFLR